MTATQQKYIDFLFEFQCCLADKTIELNHEDEIGSDCYIKDLSEATEISLILDALLCEDIDNPTCLTEDEILKMINYLKTKCNNCCLNIKDLKKLLNA